MDIKKSENITNGQLENRQDRFYNLLSKVFMGVGVKGDSGYANLLKLKHRYYQHIKPLIQKEIENNITKSYYKYDFYDRVYTFFSNYLNETGTPFFANTAFDNKIYERVYSSYEDTSLFYKTAKCFYVKSEANYKDLKIPCKDITFNFTNFTTDLLQKQKANEKITLDFYLTNFKDNIADIKVVKKENLPYEAIKSIIGDMDTKEVTKYLHKNYNTTIIGLKFLKCDLENRFKKPENIFFIRKDSLTTVGYGLKEPKDIAKATLMSTDAIKETIVNYKKTK